MLDYLEPLKEENKELYKICTELPKKKIGTFDVRTYLMRVSFEACSGRKWTEKIKHVCVAIELELASMYFTNRIFDDKGGNEILSQPNNQFIAAMITRDLASQALTKGCSKVDYKTFVKIKDIFDEMNKIFYIGQFLEVNINLYDQKSKLDWEEMLNLYYRRNYGVNNSFFEKIGIIGAILGGGTNKQIKSLSNFGKNYGMTLQIINDIGDFVPQKYNLGTSEKLSEDSYSDIKHGKLTLPVIYTLTKGTEKEKQFITEAFTNKKINNNKLIEVTKILVNNGSIRFSEKIARNFIHEAKSHLEIFEDKYRYLFEGMCFIAYTNRYYEVLRRFKEE